MATVILSAFLVGGVLGFLHHRLQKRGAPQKLINLINAELPQLQCAECGYAGCRPYAEAIAADLADINLCPPGGEIVAGRLAALMNQTSPKMPPPKTRQTAFIREAECVGCALCLPVCPTDAIIGAARQTHTVVANDCVGCEFCVAACPVNCIEMK